MSKCTDTPVASQRLARHAYPTRYVSDTASRVVQLCFKWQIRAPVENIAWTYVLTQNCTAILQSCRMSLLLAPALRSICTPWEAQHDS